jgi:hypothetical protein
MSVAALEPPRTKRRYRRKSPRNKHRETDYEPYDGGLSVNLTLSALDDLPATEEADLDDIVYLWLPRPTIDYHRNRR